MAITVHRRRADVALLALTFTAHVPLQAWALFVGPLPGLNASPSLWPNLAAYGLAAPWVAYLLWTWSPRARLAAYVFLTFDILRSVRDSHWLPLAVDAAIILYLQTPSMRRLYPSMWSRRKVMWHRRARRA